MDFLKKKKKKKKNILIKSVNPKNGIIKFNNTKNLAKKINLG